MDYAFRKWPSSEKIHTKLSIWKINTPIRCVSNNNILLFSCEIVLKFVAYTISFTSNLIDLLNLFKKKNAVSAIGVREISCVYALRMKSIVDCNTDTMVLRAYIFRLNMCYVVRMSEIVLFVGLTIQFVERFTNENMTKWDIF